MVPGGVLAGVLASDHGHCSLEPAAASLALGAGSGRSRWIVRCGSVSTSFLPVTYPSPSSLPCGAKTGANFGFSKMGEPFLPVRSWISCFGLSGPSAAGQASLLQAG